MCSIPAFPLQIKKKRTDELFLFRKVDLIIVAALSCQNKKKVFFFFVSDGLWCVCVFVYVVVLLFFYCVHKLEDNVLLIDY